MKKTFKCKSSSVPVQIEPDVADLISKMQEQLVNLEKKIDTLISKASERPSVEKHFSKPFQRFDNSHRHDPSAQATAFSRGPLLRIPPHRQDKKVPRALPVGLHNGRQDSSFRERAFTRVICADCQKECEVPFKPSAGRPVYCKECFSKRKEEGGSGSFKVKYDTRPGEGEFTQARRFDKKKGGENRRSDKKKKPFHVRRKKYSHS